MDMAGMTGIDAGAISAIKSSEPAGVVSNGVYQESGGPWLNFGTATFTLTGCGKLVPNGHSYTISKRPDQLLINVKSEPTAFVLSMGSDGKLSGPGPVDVKGQIITGYHRIWVHHYHNGIAVADGSYWTSEPIYEAKTEKCTIATFVQAPPPPPEKNPFMNTLTSMMNAVTPQGPPGLRMLGRYVSQGGFTLEFAADAVVIDCGAAHVKETYTVENAANQLLVNVKNGTAPFTLALQPNGTLAGSGSATIAGRVVTGATQNTLTYAPKTASCPISTLAPQGNSR